MGPRKVSRTAPRWPIAATPLDDWCWRPQSAFVSFWCEVYMNGVAEIMI